LFYDFYSNLTQLYKTINEFTMTWSISEYDLSHILLKNLPLQIKSRLSCTPTTLMP